MTAFEWLHGGLLVIGFLATWIIGAFKLGRAVEQIRADLKEDIDGERDKILAEIRALENKFDDEQRAQDRNFGEVGAAMRQYTADVEKKLREVEIYGRDNYVKIPDFKEALERLSSEIKSVATDIKNEIRSQSLQKVN